LLDIPKKRTARPAEYVAGFEGALGLGSSILADGLFLPRFFATFGAFEISCCVYVQCKENCFVLWYMLVSAMLTLVVAGSLLNFYQKWYCNQKR